jgi:hypothetical protein
MQIQQIQVLGKGDCHLCLFGKAKFSHATETEDQISHLLCAFSRAWVALFWMASLADKAAPGMWQLRSLGSLQVPSSH